MWYTPPKELQAKPRTTLPLEFRRLGTESDHSQNQKRGRALDSFLEGPAVVGNTLYLTDIPYGRIFAVDLVSYEWRLLKEYDGEPNGLAWHAKSQRLIITDFKQGILALDPWTCELTTLLARFNGERLKGPNDLVVTREGSIIFTDQGMSGLQDPSGRVFRLLVQPDGAFGRPEVIMSNCPSPNGLVLDKTESLLFVAMTRDNSVWLGPLFSDGSVQRIGRFSSYFGVGGPDGMATDEEGNIFVAHSTLGTIFVHTGAGLPLARIMTTAAGHGSTNLTWGGVENKTLYIIESDSGTVMEIEWHCPGCV
ncbi:calcium-dependent phosphotriesterase [Thozetella sp. PMI_491]|nr:calcium-dependent phosphotriesterase [Thozetella sp. PMI_491]